MANEVIGSIKKGMSDNPVGVVTGGFLSYLIAKRIFGFESMIIIVPFVIAGAVLGSGIHIKKEAKPVRKTKTVTDKAIVVTDNQQK